MTALVLVLVLAGAGAGHLVDRAAARFPWPRPATVGTVLGGRGGAAPRGVLEAATAALFGLAALRFGPTAELPAWLWLATAGVLLAVVDLRERLLPNRVVLPALAGGVLLLSLAALTGGAGDALLRAVLAAAALFAVYLAMALVSPGLGMGDVKLAALLGLYLGWLGWPAVVLGALAGFVLQAVVALALLATRRIGLRGELPFGPAMLAGAALVAAAPVLLS
ncbi:leader peptidase (prepilin peptidase) / N-methyltransferase [Geodermatophilus saharensis]|uniref:Leader peptidase (Prepilin peptidase) / N-methyltransferase n=1 Tax=Geodermatophilus saharensis TaxID=1137994 RepID=A0A239BMH9_9ACTN|nr:prepilin peptidase [Geodermatophilus saharensis]SNS09180.1 leader peptidase (prepilin peptidase) / N-methyltransferase [Geodermatophilus saharensis]